MINIYMNEKYMGYTNKTKKEIRLIGRNDVAFNANENYTYIIIDL